MAGTILSEPWYCTRPFTNVGEKVEMVKGKVDTIRMYLDVLAVSKSKGQRRDAISKTRTILKGIQESWDWVNQELLKKRRAHNWREFPGLQQTVDDIHSLIHPGIIQDFNMVRPEYPARTTWSTPANHSAEPHARPGVEHEEHSAPPRSRSRSPAIQQITSHPHSVYRDRSDPMSRNNSTTYRSRRHSTDPEDERTSWDSERTPKTTDKIGHTGRNPLTHQGARIHEGKLGFPVPVEQAKQPKTAVQALLEGNSTRHLQVGNNAFTAYKKTTTTSDTAPTRRPRPRSHLEGPHTFLNTDRRNGTVPETAQPEGYIIPRAMTYMHNRKESVNASTIGLARYHEGRPLLPRYPAVQRVENDTHGPFNNKPADMALSNRLPSESPMVIAPHYATHGVGPNAHNAYQDIAHDAAESVSRPSSNAHGEAVQMIPFSLSEKMQRAIVIDQVWWQKIKPALEVDSIPIQQFAIEHIEEIESRTELGCFTAQPFVLCIPFSEGRLQDTTLADVLRVPLKVSPAQFVPQWGIRVPVHSIIASKCLSSQSDGSLPPFAQSCGNKACMLPQHVFIPSPDTAGQEPSRCRFIPEEPTYDSRIPLYCPEHGPTCRPALAVMNDIETTVACWMYSCRYTSPDQAPPEILGNIPDEYLDTELRTFNVGVAQHEEGHPCYMYLSHKDTLRGYILRNTATDDSSPEDKSEIRDIIKDINTSDLDYKPSGVDGSSQGSNGRQPGHRDDNPDMHAGSPDYDAGLPDQGDNGSDPDYTDSGSDRSSTDHSSSGPGEVTPDREIDISRQGENSSGPDYISSSSGADRCRSGPEKSPPGIGINAADTDSAGLIAEYTRPDLSQNIEVRNKVDMLVQDGIRFNLPDPRTDVHQHTPGRPQPTDVDENFNTAPSQSVQQSHAPVQFQNGTVNPNDTPQDTGVNEIAQRISRAKDLGPLGSKNVRLELESIQHQCLREWLESPTAEDFFRLCSAAGVGGNDTDVCILCVGLYHSGLDKCERRPGNPLKAQHIRDGSTKALITHVLSHNQGPAVKAMALHAMIKNTSWLSDAFSNASSQKYGILMKTLASGHFPNQTELRHFNQRRVKA